MQDRLFTHLFDDSHAAFRGICRDFTERHLTPHAEAWEEAEAFPDGVFAQLAEAGILGVTYPEDLGGGGGDLFHGIVAAEELLRCGSAGLISGLHSYTIALPPLVALGTPEQLDRFVRPVIAGNRIAALAITEPGTGSDVAGVRTKAVRDGDSYVLNGAKTFITSGCRAHQVTVLARTGEDPHGGLTFFVVEQGTPGFSVSKALRKTGWRASDTAELHFDDVRIPIANRVGPEGSGFVALMQNFEKERLALAVQGHAIAEICYHDAVSYSQQRVAFGRPIGKFQVTKHKLADMITAILSAKALTYAVADRMRRGEHVVAEVAMAKNHAAMVARDVSWEAVQILGGMGYCRETRVERLSRDARLLPIGGGTQEVMKELIPKFL